MIKQKKKIILFSSIITLLISIVFSLLWFGQLNQVKAVGCAGCGYDSGLHAPDCPAYRSEIGGGGIDYCTTCSRYVSIQGHAPTCQSNKYTITYSMPISIQYDKSCTESYDPIYDCYDVFDMTETVDIPHGEKIINYLPDPKTKLTTEYLNCFSFVGWNIVGRSDNEPWRVDKNMTATRNMELSAEWSERKIDITFKPNGGTFKKSDSRLIQGDISEQFKKNSMIPIRGFGIENFVNRIAYLYRDGYYLSG